MQDLQEYFGVIGHVICHYYWCVVKYLMREFPLIFVVFSSINAGFCDSGHFLVAWHLLRLHSLNNLRTEL